MTYVDSTILKVALPPIARQFRVGVADLQWVADAYLLVLSSFIRLVGSLADRIGRRRVFMTGLLLFSAGSLLCSVAPSVQLLIVFRMLQAIGGCMLTPVSLSILRQVFTDPDERARALGVWSAIFGIGIATGPILGGVLVSGIGWRSVFWVNVPVGAAAWVLARTYVPESRAPAVRRVDPAGQLLVISLLSSTTFAVIDGASLSWGSPAIVSAFALGAVSLVLLIVVERSRFEPLVELHFFKSPTFSVAIGAAITCFLALSGLLVRQHPLPPRGARRLGVHSWHLAPPSNGRNRCFGARLGAPRRSVRTPAADGACRFRHRRSAVRFSSISSPIRRTDS